VEWPFPNWGEPLHLLAFPSGESGYDQAMNRPKKYAEHRYIGDKRNQLVYDLDEISDESVIEELVASEQVATFGPDTLAEARNRGYRLRSV